MSSPTTVSGLQPLSERERMALVKFDMREWGVHPTWVEVVCVWGVDHAESWFKTCKYTPEWHPIVKRPYWDKVPARK